MKLTAAPWPAELAARFGSALLAPLLLVGLTVLVAERATALPDDAAFRVEDTVVTTEEFENRLDTLEALYGLQAPDGGPQRDRFRRSVAKALVISMVLEGAARERGIVVGEKTARDALAQGVRQGFRNGRQGFAQLLGRVGASQQGVVEEIKLRQTIARLYRQVVSGSVSPITDTELRRFYDRNRAQLIRPPTRRLRNIVVASQSKATQVIEMARSGTPFDQLVQRNSLDQSTRRNGGDLGFVARQQLAGAYGRAAFSAAEGALFGPVQTRFGWNVGKVVQIRPSKQLQFSRVENQLRAGLRSRRVLRAWRDWVTQQIQQADITYADRYRPAKPTTLTDAGARFAPGQRSGPQTPPKGQAPR